MKKIFFIATLVALISNHESQAVDFDSVFADRTLRLDYVFAGDSATQYVFLDELATVHGWAGRRHNLERLPLAGNGEIVVTEPVTGDTLYRTSFSSLFQEWQTTEEAARVRRAFENTYLVPFPKQPVDITISLKDVYGKVNASMCHRVDPADILIHRKGESRITPHRYVHQGGDSKDCIDIAIMAEGYGPDEMEQFYADAAETVDALFAHEPFGSMRERFNIVAVESPSLDSGVSEPKDSAWRQTAVNSHFSTFYSDRYLTTRSTKKIHDHLAGIPYEHIIILANTPTYGGGGIYNSYTLTTARDKWFRPVVVHEFGHSFGGLADEYYYDDSYSDNYPAGHEPWEPNITTLTDFPSKWLDMLPNGVQIPTPQVPTNPDEIYTKLGVYEGAGYSSKGVYRPVAECRMKINQAPGFCPVCQRALERLIRFYTE